MAVIMFVVLVSWTYSHRRGVALAFTGLMVGWIALDVLRRRARRPEQPRKITDDSVPLGTITPGMVHTMGLVHADERHAPLASVVCVFYRVVVDTGHEPNNVIYEGRSADELTLDDGVGTSLVVHLDRATWSFERCFDIEYLPDAPNEAVQKYLAERQLPTDKPLRVRVQWIGPHELLFVRGFVPGGAPKEPAGYRTSERAPFEMRASHEHPLVLSLGLH
jgi:hypothetical protein